MPFTIDFSERNRSDQNKIVDKLLADMNLSSHYVAHAEFSEGTAEIGIESKGLEKGMKLGGLFKELRGFDGGVHIYFELPSEKRVVFKEQRGFHHFLNRINFPELPEGVIPEEMQATLQYKDVPFGFLDALPENILKHLSGFRISNSDMSQGESINWPAREGNKREITPYAERFFGEDEGKTEELYQLLTQSGFLDKVTTNTGRNEKTKFFLKEGIDMDFERLSILEKLLEGMRHDPDSYDFRGDYSFAGKMRTQALEGIPDLFDYVRSEELISCPSFSVQSGGSYESNKRTIVEVRNGDLETAAKISPAFYESVEISFEKK